MVLFRRKDCSAETKHPWELILQSDMNEAATQHALLNKEVTLIACFARQAEPGDPANHCKCVLRLCNHGDISSS